MPAPPKFADFGKKAKDLFKKEYDFKNEVKVVNKTKGGVKLESGGYQGKAVDGFTKATWKDDTVGEIEIEAHTCGEVKGQVKLPSFIDGASSTLNADSKGNISLDTHYHQDFYLLTAKVSHALSKSNTCIDASASLGFEGVSVGGSLCLDAADLGSPKDFNVGAQYAHGDLLASLVTANQGADITASYFQKVSKELSLGSSVAIKPESGNRLFTFGYEFGLDDNTKIKKKFDSNGIIAASITHKLKDLGLTCCVSSQYDAFGSDMLVAQKFGFGITFGD